MKHICWASPLVALVLALVAPAAELEVVQTIQLKGKAGNLDHLALDAKRERLFLANKANNTLDVIDLKSGKLLEQKPNQTAIQGLAYAADLDRVFVGLGSNGLCNVIDGADYKIKETIKFKDDADNVRYNPKTGMVYVAHAEKALGVINAKTFAQKADIKLPATAEGFVMETGRPRMYLVTPSPSQVVLIDTDKNEVVKSYPVKMASGGHPIALDEANHRIYIGCRDKPMIVIMDTETGKEVGGAEIPGGIDDLHIDLKRKQLYASCGEGFLVVLKIADGDKLETAEKVKTVKDARTCVFEPETSRIYLGVPRQEGKEGPEVRIYQVK